MADWFLPTLILFPFAAWMFWGVGIPWALALLPRDWWRARIIVIAVGMALGPLLFTAWMFVLGTFASITLIDHPGGQSRARGAGRGDRVAPRGAAFKQVPLSRLSWRGGYRGVSCP